MSTPATSRRTTGSAEITFAFLLMTTSFVETVEARPEAADVESNLGESLSTSSMKDRELGSRLAVGHRHQWRKGDSCRASTVEATEARPHEEGEFLA